MPSFYRCAEILSVVALVFFAAGSARAADCNTNGIQDHLEPGYSDCDSNTTADFCEGSGLSILPSTDTPLVIADFATVPFVVNSVLSAGVTGNVGDVNVQVNIHHTYEGDIIIVLQNSSATATLFNRHGVGNDDFNGTVFDDQAATPISASALAGYSDTYQPDEPLSAFGGTAIAGTWTLTVSDNAGIDTGTLLDWTLFIVSAGQPDCNTNGTPDICDIAGGASADCNTNSVPDRCEILVNAALDCNTDGTIDVCQLGGRDCNTNGTLDRCDLRNGAVDCNTDNSIDLCQPLVDADADGVPDVCDNCKGLNNPDQSPWLDHVVQGATGAVTGNAGQFASLRVAPNGRVGEAYYEITNVSPQRGRLQYWTDTNTNFVAEATEIRTIDASTANVGQFTSLLYDASNRAMIAYYDVSTKQIKLWYDANTNTSADAGEIGVIDKQSPLVLGQYASLKLDSAGKITCAYFRVTTSSLKIWHDADGNHSASASEIAFIDGSGVSGGTDAGSYCSLGFNPAGQAVISYYDIFNHALKLWVDTNTNYLPNAGEFHTIDNSGDAGRHTSLAFDAAGRATVAYQDTFGLRPRLWHDANGNYVADGGEISILDADVSTNGLYNSLAFDASGNAMVAYQQGTAGDLKLWRDLNGNYVSNAGEVSTVRSTGTVGAYASLAFHPTMFTPMIAYRDDTSTNLSANLTLLLDWDGDGFCFTSDTCPGLYNPSQIGPCTGLACGDRAKGDINGDSFINASDVSGFVNILLSPTFGTANQRCAADINNDTLDNGSDIAGFVQLLLP